MPGCVLHVVGEMLDPSSALAGLTVRPYSVFRKGDRVFPRGHRNDKVYEIGGFKCLVSAPNSDLAQEVADAIQFLAKYEADLRRLGSAPGVEAMSLDFGYNLRIDDERCVVQCDFLPPRLLKLCGSLGIGIALSLYPGSQEGP